MNTILNFVQQNWQRFRLEEDISPNQLTCLILTPRFRASNHLIGLVMPKDKANPILVVKIPRQVEAYGLAQEAYNLSKIQKCQQDGFPSIPRLLVYEPFLDRSILVETALIGHPMDPALIRKELKACCDRTVAWLINLHQSTQIPNQNDQDWYARLVEQPIDYFEEFFPLLPEEVKLLNNTRRIVKQLQGTDIPLVFEHGDLSHPNLLLSNDNQLGVLDWETAKVNGLPYCDLLFFLNYAATSYNRAKSLSDYVSAFKKTFYESKSWLSPYLKLYSEELSISSELASFFFVLCWARYSINLLERMTGEQPNQIIDETTANWLRSNRFFALWQYSVNHFDEFALTQRTG